MKPVITHTFTHANHKVPVEVAVELIFSYYVSPAHQSTYLVSTGGAIIPVLESPELIKNLLKNNGEIKNGTN